VAKERKKTSAGEARERQRKVRVSRQLKLMAQGHIVEHRLCTDSSPNVTNTHGNVALIQILKPGMTSALLTRWMKTLFDGHIRERVESTARKLMSGVATRDISTDPDFQRVLSAYERCASALDHKPSGAPTGGAYRYVVNRVESAGRPSSQLVDGLNTATRGLPIFEGDGLHASVMFDLPDRLVFASWDGRH